MGKRTLNILVGVLAGVIIWAFGYWLASELFFGTGLLQELIFNPLSFLINRVNHSDPYKLYSAAFAAIVVAPNSINAAAWWLVKKYNLVFAKAMFATSGYITLIVGVGSISISFLIPLILFGRL